MFQYTQNICFEIARKCATKADFKRANASAYAVARKHGWLHTYDWFVSGRMRPKKWSDVKCEEEARKYTRKVDFERKSSGAYKYAASHGLLEKFDWFQDCAIDLEYGRIYCVYCYIFLLGVRRYIYIGLTLRPNIRDRKHREGGSAVYDFAIDHSMSIPPMQILKRNLTQSEARAEEDRYRRVYEGAGYEILNRAKTGAMIGSVGGMHRKWTKGKCRDEARKYASRGAFEKGEPSAYQAALYKGWLKEYDWFEYKHHKRWTLEEFLIVAQKYNSKKEFQQGNNAAYIVGCTRGWMGKCTWFKAGRGWAVCTPRPRKDSRRVIQMMPSGVPIARYATANEAIQKSGVTSLRKCLNGERKQAGGFLWRYEDAIPVGSIPQKLDALRHNIRL